MVSQTRAHRHKPPSAAEGWRLPRSACLSLGPISPLGFSLSAPLLGQRSPHCQTYTQTHTLTLTKNIITHLLFQLYWYLRGKSFIKHLKCHVSKKNKSSYIWYILITINKFKIQSIFATSLTYICVFVFIVSFIDFHYIWDTALTYINFTGDVP